MMSCAVCVGAVCHPLCHVPCRLLPLVALVLHCRTSRQGIALVHYGVYDMFVYAQKLAPCALTYTRWQAYGSTLFTLTLTAVVFAAWLKLRVQSHQGRRHVRSTALLMFTCVFGLETYVLIGEAQWFNTAVAGPVTHWQRGFHVAMLVYVVLCITWCVTQVALRLRRIVRGPALTSRPNKATVRTSTPTAGVWVREMAAFVQNGVKARGHHHSGSATGDSERQYRIAAITAAQVLEKTGKRGFSQQL